MTGMKILSVSQLNFFAKSVLDSNEALKNVFLTGEISNFKNHYQSGHMYFSLKDDKSTIKAAFFSYFKRNLKFLPADGMKVIVRGRVSIYEATGTFQIYVEDMQPDGIGALNLAFEQLKNKLEKEGLFDINHKKSIPRFPKKVGVITSKSGAAFFDIQSILKRRCPMIEILFCPVCVQGTEAPAQIVDAINYMNESTDADILIVSRGGGSIEDLWAFNDESLARAIYNSKIPIVSAVGHETDFTICDFVSDLRAPTPSAAAELVSFDKDELLKNLSAEMLYMNELIKKRIFSYNQILNRFKNNEVIYNPKALIEKRALKLDILKNKLLLNFTNAFNGNKNNFLRLVSKLEILSPLKILSLGYSIATFKNKKIIKTVNDIKCGDEINIKLKDGTLNCAVTKVNLEE